MGHIIVRLDMCLKRTDKFKVHGIIQHFWSKKVGIDFAERNHFCPYLIVKVTK